MKLARCEHPAVGIFWAVVDVAQDQVTPISGDFRDWAPGVAAGRGISSVRLAGPALALSKVCLLPPIEPINRVVVAGANYAKHLVEFGLNAPAQPVAFLKAYGALIGARDPIRFPPLTEELDHEVELVVVIGTGEIDVENPMACVLGYTVGNDVSARDLQRSGPPGIGMDLFAAKSQDRTTGLGPWIVTKDEFAEGSPRLRLTLKVNGEVRQDGSTAEMTWDVGQLISFVQQRSSFATGDVLFTGSPAGVGMGTGLYLKEGDVVEASVEGIGTLRNVVGKKPQPIESQT
ncbi:fumarylacetoacetate hydrolase family protein [Pseudomonas sp. GD03817]|mgnify:CR=1 FL=1|jgi:2-keto-4-pentenoate hydratase/2-oxohepta-3-ene-1,7-dioic acid hydratase in catechol pathway|uniref:Hydrolase n=1 Tax=Pseudomonas putida TaxID=303 RepID=A0A1L5PT52_PSEPU|nr:MULTISPECIES: fumarylacetoacetate hydrolase family protein [Pseudomonas]APO83265.1 hydrolase [Pseudomonas putida]KIY42277.1 hydrolase [Pseudomonas sp. 10-1B]MBA6136302.1 fumarylacetoacetate hydrolase family protein [Pseudomonas monteilii]MBF8804180.1 fumarylacetoacetate hydrolase family protein [Pseudomonas asiatica]MCE0989583.1 fumarylacetoacetate hydrolase family protein [Pseudomonas alloputida]